MMLSVVVDVGYGPQTYRVAANILNGQSCTEDNGWNSNLYERRVYDSSP